MEAILCGASALDYWRRHPELLGDSYSSRRTAPLRKGNIPVDTPSAEIVNELATMSLVSPSDAHLLVTSTRARRKIHGVTCTVCSGPFPANSFVRAMAQVYVPRPELLFLLLARHLSFVRLLEVGFEICGTYRLAGGVATYDAPPLASVASICDYANRATGLHGRKNALRAAQWLVDGSGSPAETALAIVLGLPYRHGGYGLGGFQLNRELQLNESAARILGRTTIRPDFYWPTAKHPAEYDSAQYHSTREQADYDERRRNAYDAMGMSVTVFRSRHLVDFSLMDEMACSIRKNIGMRTTPVPAGYAYLKSDLLEEAFRSWVDLRDEYGTGEEFLARSAAWSEPPYLW